MRRVGGFRVRVCLGAYYGREDSRRAQALWLGPARRALTVAGLEREVTRVFGLRGGVRLRAGGLLLPRGEGARLVRPTDTLEVLLDSDCTLSAAAVNEQAVSKPTERRNECAAAGEGDVYALDGPCDSDCSISAAAVVDEKVATRPMESGDECGKGKGEDTLDVLPTLFTHSAFSDCTLLSAAASTGGETAAKIIKCGPECEAAGEEVQVALEAAKERALRMLEMTAPRAPPSVRRRVRRRPRRSLLPAPSPPPPTDTSTPQPDPPAPHHLRFPSPPAPSSPAVTLHSRSSSESRAPRIVHAVS